jgi:transposase
MADMTSEEREREMIAAYRRGEKVTDIEERFEVGRSTLYHVLRRAGVTPQRSRRQVDAASGDARLAGLAELISHQDRLIQELQAKLDTATKRVTKLDRDNAALRARLGEPARNNGSRGGKRTVS